MVDIHSESPRGRGGYEAPHGPSTAEDVRTVLLNRVSWGAVFAGAAVALVVQLILNLLGIGLGAAAVNPLADAASNPSAQGFSITAGLWWAITGIIASAAGGYTAGRLAGRPNQSTAGWHGLTAWALTTLVLFYLLTTTVGSIIGGAYSTIASATGPMASTAGSAMRIADPFNRVEQSLRSATGDPAIMRESALAALRAAFTGDPAQAQEARERAAQDIAKVQSVSIDQARAQVQQYEQQFRDAVNAARQEAAKAADTARQAISAGALVSVVALILGGIAAWFGGRMGTVESPITEQLGWSGRGGNGQR